MKSDKNIKRFEVTCSNVSENINSYSTFQVRQIIYFGNSEKFEEQRDFFISKLSDDEINRMQRFVFDVDRLTYCIVHGLLRLSLIEKLNVAELKIESPQDFKPHLINNEIDFNLSHSKNYFAYAIASIKKGNIGVDIEKINYLKDFKSIIGNYMHRDEQEYILDNMLTNNEQIVRFYEIWTRKEALLKMLGAGIVRDLPSINMIQGNTICNIDIPENYQGKEEKVNLYTLHKNDIIISISADYNFVPDFVEVKP